MKSKNKNINKAIEKAIIREGRAEIRDRFGKLSAEQAVPMISITEQFLNPVAKAAFGRYTKLEYNPLRVSDETLREFIEEEDNVNSIPPKKKKKVEKK